MKLKPITRPEPTEETPVKVSPTIIEEPVIEKKKSEITSTETIPLPLFKPLTHTLIIDIKQPKQELFSLEEDEFDRLAFELLGLLKKKLSTM